MPTAKDFFAYTVVERDTGGMITGRLLCVCLTLEKVCQYLRRHNLAVHQVHVCGWDNIDGQWVIPPEKIEQAMQREGQTG